jgi:LmbE family N-acetylglucosaminyl deacetylase
MRALRLRRPKGRPVLLDEPRRVLVVVAHCDDAEWMFGGTVARLVAGGAEIAYVVTTDGSNGGIDVDRRPPSLLRSGRPSNRPPLTCWAWAR